MLNKLVLQSSLLLAKCRIFTAIASRSSSCSWSDKQAEISRESILVRRAEVKDIYGIRNCNMENLPENYNEKYYFDLLCNWPTLSIIAEDENCKCIGYVLGKVEAAHRYPLCSHENNPSLINVDKENRTVGHVISIAVNERFRKQGVAVALMRRLHYSMLHDYNITDIYLHCRVSNHNAITMYQKYFQYELDTIVPKYYADDEDAYLMKMSMRRNQTL